MEAEILKTHDFTWGKILWQSCYSNSCLANDLSKTEPNCGGLNTVIKNG